VTGFVGRPSATRANRQLQWFYVNGRFVRSPLFYRALDEAYRASMPQGRYPLAVLFLEIDPAAVDVNVHPSKIEVRFRDEGAVYGAILAAVAETLGPVVVPEIASWPPPSAGVVREAVAPYYTPVPPDTAPEDPPSPQHAGSDPSLPFADAALWQPGGRPPASPRYGSPSIPMTPPRSPAGEPPAHDPRPASDDPFVPEHRPTAAPGRPVAPSPATAPQGPTPGIPVLTPIGQVRDLFLLAEGEGRLWIVDQHVAHERILFERLADPARRETAEPLLFPLTLPLDQRQALVLEEHRGVLGEMGFVIEPFGDNNYIVRAVPISLVGKNYEQALRDMIDEMSALSEGGRVHLRREQVAMAAAGRACKAALKAGKGLSHAEMTRLLADLRHAHNPYTCPHGRPIFLQFNEEEIATLFGELTCG
jgi:DNA mismatch repair protein MutL